MKTILRPKIKNFNYMKEQRRDDFDVVETLLFTDTWSLDVSCIKITYLTRST